MSAFEYERYLIHENYDENSDELHQYPLLFKLLNDPLVKHLPPGNALNCKLLIAPVFGAFQ